MERTAGPHSTSLRAGFPLRYAPVGMTIHILAGPRVPKKDCHRNKSQPLGMTKERVALPCRIQFLAEGPCC